MENADKVEQGRGRSERVRQYLLLDAPALPSSPSRRSFSSGNPSGDGGDNDDGFDTLSSSSATPDRDRILTQYRRAMHQLENLSDRIARP